MNKQSLRIKRKAALAVSAVSAAVLAVSPALALGSGTAQAAGATSSCSAGFRLIPAGSYRPLPIGDPDLTETRCITTLAPGVTLTQIVRGTAPATAATMDTTLEGPWDVNVVAIDPAKARGHLEDVRGQYLTDRNTVGDLVTRARGLVGVNGAPFDIDDNYGVPLGMAIRDGQIIGDPEPASPEGNWSGGAIIDPATSKLLSVGTFTWSGTIENTRTRQALALTHVDKNTTVPPECAAMTDQTECTVPGDLIHFDRIWGPTTPAGSGVEVVLDKTGHVVRADTTRGTALAPGETSIQATGSDAAQLLSLISGGGRITTTQRLYENGVQVRPAGLQGLGGWQPTPGQGLVVGGVNEDPYPAGSRQPDGGRNPITVVAATARGTIQLITFAGRSTTSVGVAGDEADAALVSLGAYNALQLDGGGSTEMVANGQYLTTSSDGTERPVGDALVWVP